MYIARWSLRYLACHNKIRLTVAGPHRIRTCFPYII
nr:MAG TPA: hypothetical protein [Caudoviricetes sp.]DAY12877.1 MAG TPA: hypothetical protein [Caudoviricetes sp.]